MARSVADLDRIVSALLAQVQSESTQSITDVQFETGVEDADAVFLDTNYNTWRRSIVGAVNGEERAIFHGVANVNDAGNSVRIYGFQSSDNFTIYDDELDTVLELFVPGDFVYVSTRALGAYTQTPNEIQAGVAVGADRFLLASELDNVTTALRGILNDSKDQTLITVTDAQRLSGYTWASLQMRLDGNFSRIEETDDNIAALVVELAAAYGTSNSIDGRFSAVESITDANTAELNTSAGTSQTLHARLAVGMNDDGTLKASISASTYTTEVETLTRVGSNSFSIPVDKSGIYTARRTVRINDLVTAHVNFSSYTNEITLVTLVEAVIPVALAKIEYSFSPSELPIVRHTDLTEVRTVDPASTDTVRTKHVSNNDLKVINDAVSANDSVIDAHTAKLATSGTAFTADVGTSSTQLTTNTQATSISNTRAAAQIAALGLGAASTYAVGTSSNTLTTNTRANAIAAAKISALGLRSGATTTVGTAAVYNVGTGSSNLPTYGQTDARITARRLNGALYTVTNHTSPGTVAAPSGYRFLSVGSKFSSPSYVSSINSTGTSVGIGGTSPGFSIVWVKNT